MNHTIHYVYKKHQSHQSFWVVFQPPKKKAQLSSKGPFPRIIPLGNPSDRHGGLELMITAVNVPGVYPLVNQHSNEKSPFSIGHQQESGVIRGVHHFLVGGFSPTHLKNIRKSKWES